MCSSGCCWCCCVPIRTPTEHPTWPRTTTGPGHMSAPCALRVRCMMLPLWLCSRGVPLDLHCLDWNPWLKAIRGAAAAAVIDQERRAGGRADGDAARCSHVGLLGPGRRRIAHAVHLMLQKRGQNPEHAAAHRNRTDAPHIGSDDRAWTCSEAATHNERTGQATRQERCAMRQLSCSAPPRCLAR
jgi:hypothetical protein